LVLSFFLSVYFYFLFHHFFIFLFYSVLFCLA
jgi:hypothetical protein